MLEPQPSALTTWLRSPATTNRLYSPLSSKARGQRKLTGQSPHIITFALVRIQTRGFTECDQDPSSNFIKIGIRDREPV
jgi:hypothetical protein